MVDAATLFLLKFLLSHFGVNALKLSPHGPVFKLYQHLGGLRSRGELIIFDCRGSVHPDDIGLVEHNAGWLQCNVNLLEQERLIVPLAGHDCNSLYAYGLALPVLLQVIYEHGLLSNDALVLMEEPQVVPNVATKMTDGLILLCNNFLLLIDTVCAEVKS